MSDRTLGPQLFGGPNVVPSITHTDHVRQVTQCNSFNSAFVNVSSKSHNPSSTVLRFVSFITISPLVVVLISWRVDSLSSTPYRNNSGSPRSRESDRLARTHRWQARQLELAEADAQEARPTTPVLEPRHRDDGHLGLGVWPGVQAA